MIRYWIIWVLAILQQLYHFDVLLGFPPGAQGQRFYAWSRWNRVVGSFVCWSTLIWAKFKAFGEKYGIFLNILLTNSSVQMADVVKSFSSGLCCDTSLLAEEFWCLFK